MMLASLVELADRENLTENLDYEKKQIHYEVRIRPDGQYVALISRLDEKGRGASVRVPRMPKRSVAVLASFLFDNSKYVLGLGDVEAAGSDRLQRCLAAFRGLIESAAKETEDASLSAVARFYEKFDENRARILADRPVEQWIGSENLGFSIDGMDGLVHEQPSLSRYWSRLRSRPTGHNSERQVLCLVSGDLCTPERLHPPLKRVPGGQAAGASVVSFNAKSFESHGLSQGENAPVSRRAAESYTTALNWLLEEDPLTKRRHRYGVSVGEEAVTVFWTDAGHEAMDWLSDLWNSPKPEAVRSLLEAPFSGAPTGLDEAKFFAATLSGNQARVVIRSWFQSTIGSVKRNMTLYFDDLRVGAGERPLAIWQLLAAVDPPGRAGLPPALGTRIYDASVHGSPFPRELLRYALMRLRVPPDKERSPDSLLHARIALIKATLRRTARSDDTKKHLEVTVSLDETNDQPAYNLGRLFALLEQIQAAAIDDVSATIRDRYFGSASATPAFIFPRLLKLSAHHEAKIGGGLANLFDERKRTIMRNLSAQLLPTHQNLEDQGLFAVGYYHERDWLIEDRKRRSTENKRAKEAAAAESQD